MHLDRSARTRKQMGLTLVVLFGLPSALNAQSLAPEANNGENSTVGRRLERFRSATQRIRDDRRIIESVAKAAEQLRDDAFDVEANVQKLEGDLRVNQGAISDLHKALDSIDRTLDEQGETIQRLESQSEYGGKETARLRREIGSLGKEVSDVARSSRQLVFERQEKRLMQYLMGHGLSQSEANFYLDVVLIRSAMKSDNGLLESVFSVEQVKVMQQVAASDWKTLRPDSTHASQISDFTRDLRRGVGGQAASCGSGGFSRVSPDKQAEAFAKLACIIVREITGWKLCHEIDLEIEGYREANRRREENQAIQGLIDRADKIDRKSFESDSEGNGNGWNTGDQNWGADKRGHV